MQFIIKKLLIIILPIISFQTIELKLFANEKYNFDDFGLISIMYHRFDESKYPSTNIQIDVFKEQLNIIDEEGIEFIHPKDFKKSLYEKKKNRKILLTIDDGFLSFYDKAWPMLKKNKTPFILFVNTREVGSNGYMNWDQIKEIEQSEFGVIGHHSHSHDYLIDKSEEVFLNDIKSSNQIFTCFN